MQTTTRLRQIEHKIASLERLQNLVAGWRVKGQKIVFTNGCFDLLHRGHVQLLAEAAQAGDKLVVGLNTDQSVQRLKGAGRPLTDQDARALVMAAQTFTDAVVLFDQDTPAELIEAIRPDVLVKGGDYTIDTIVGHELVQSYGGQVLVIPTVQGYSTTGTIARMNG
ncbi:MAG: D-glycero-beta-D-manno-heptose 1-phosphate adenylyltransferase [Edaphocola sp.]